MAGTRRADDALVANWRAVLAGVGSAQRRIDAVLEGSGVPAAWFGVLHALLAADAHRMTMSALAREVSMSTGGFTKLADRMAREGLIDRRGSADDRRVIHAALTEDGVALAGKVVTIHEAALRDCLAGQVSPADVAASAATLGSLRLLVEERGQAAGPAEIVATPRSPALPERRGRGRRRDAAMDGPSSPPEPDETQSS